MENLDEQVKDPNQLDLFAGVLLTTEQQEQVNKYIENQKKNSEHTQNKHKQVVELLLENDFVEGVHFEQSCKVTIETRNTRLGYSYNNTSFEAEVEYEKCDSQIYLLGQNFYIWETDKKLKPAKFWFDVEKGKIQCGSITEQYRFYKPKTILEKLQLHNKAAANQFEEYKKKENLEKNTIEKYTKLYPDAEVISKDGYTKYRGSFKIVEVKFKSGSYVQFELDTYNNKEYIGKRFDAELEKLTAEGLLDKFSKQEALK
jgi:hypothetical protein